jgi:MFS family permease
LTFRREGHGDHAETPLKINIMSNPKTTRVRFQVLGVVCSLSVVTYLDRVCIAGSAPFIMSDLHLTPVQMGAIFSAFAIAYALFEVPTGWLGDRIGPRKVITRIVVWWSFFTALTGLMSRFWTMAVVRFLFGMGEAGAYPNAAKVFSNWMPRAERGVAVGAMWTCGRWGGAFAPALVVFMITRIAWRSTFWILGAVGIVWAALFWIWFRDTPEQKCRINDAELEIIRRGRPEAVSPTESRSAVPWLRLLKSGNLWSICLMYFCVSYGWFFYTTWLPTSLKARGTTMMQAGIYGGLPLFMGGLGAFIGGLLTDYVVRKTGKLRSRRYIGFTGFFIGSLFMLGSVWVKNPLTAVWVISMASFFGDLTLAGNWAVCMDAGRELAGTVSGCMNTFGNIAGFLFPLVTGFLIQWFGRWDLPILVSGVIFFLGALLWLRIDPSEAIV